MTFKELLDSVSYDEVERQIRIMYNYPETGKLGWYKIHFDMLRLLTPKHDDDANDDVCHITMENWDDGSRPHLHAYPMEDDLWEHSLTKEIVIAPDVKATNEELPPVVFGIPLSMALLKRIGMNAYAVMTST